MGTDSKINGFYVTDRTECPINNLSLNSITATATAPATATAAKINISNDWGEPWEEGSDVNPEVKSTLTRDGSDGNLIAKFYKDGFWQSSKKLIPDIKDVMIYNNCAIVVEFMDGTTEKAVVHQCDEFSIEQGISICITKKLVGGSAIYNKLIDRALKVMLKNDAKRTEEARIKEEHKERKKKNEEKKARREAAKREKSIEAQKEAYVRAWTEINALCEGKEK